MKRYWKVTEHFGPRPYHNPPSEVVLAHSRIGAKDRYRHNHPGASPLSLTASPVYYRPKNELPPGET